MELFAKKAANILELSDGEHENKVTGIIFKGENLGDPQILD
jgi:hypothetical protein